MSIRQQTAETPVGPFGRAALIGFASVFAGCFVVALCLSPDPRGYGTHQQLGLPPCTFRLMFGCPCPGCGMTTSFVHFVRGDLAASVRANAAGAVMAIVFALLIPWCVTSAWFGRLWFVSNPFVAGGILAMALSALALVVWVSRLIGPVFFALRQIALYENWC